MSAEERLDAAALLLTVRDLQRAIGCAVLAVRADAGRRAEVLLIEAQRGAARLEVALGTAARADADQAGRG
jgi:hypothetical protein